MTRVHPPRYTAEASFRSPLVVLPLAVRGGLESNAQLLNSQDLFALINDIQANSRPPLAILPLMGAVRNGVACEVGPVSCHVTHHVVFPSCHLYSTQPRDRACSYWSFANPVGIRPCWPVASPVGVRRLQS
jgi:hypothetical protein